MRGTIANSGEKWKLAPSANSINLKDANMAKTSNSIQNISILIGLAVCRLLYNGMGYHVNTVSAYYPLFYIVPAQWLLFSVWRVPILSVYSSVKLSDEPLLDFIKVILVIGFFPFVNRRFVFSFHLLTAAVLL